MSARDDYPLHRALEMLNDCPSALDEIDRLRRREAAWAADVVWRANWMTRAVNLLGDIRDVVQDEWPEHLAELEQLLADEFEDAS